MQILLVIAEISTRSAIAFLLESELGLKVKETSTMQEGLACLLDDTLKFDALICYDNAENQKLFKYLMTGDGQTQCLVVKEPAAPALLAFPDLIAGYINPASVVPEIKKYFSEKLKSAKPETKEGMDVDYCRVRGTTAMQSFPLLLDLFVRLSSQKYVRIFKKGDTFSGNDAEGYLQKKNIEFLYCQKKDAAIFANKLKEELAKNFNSAAPTPEGDTKSAMGAQEAVMEIGNRIGFTPEVQELAKQGMIATLRTVGNGKPSLSRILKGILLEKDKYIGSHAILTSQVACSLASSISWSSETTFQKLTFAAFFHDMLLTNNSLAQIKTMDELEKRKSEFTEDEMKRFKMHPILASQVIATFSEVPADVDMIISQHHEKPDGSGWPRRLEGPNISPLSSLFIVAHDIVDQIFTHGTKDMDKFYNQYREKYSSGHFKKILAQANLGSLGF